ncbi:MAG: mechanosensitive ion channel [Gammaproteobacteria bacterium]|nr:mechanosensitive ion channel [Gammaproteobacteria bacterium]
MRLPNRLLTAVFTAAISLFPGAQLFGAEDGARQIQARQAALVEEQAALEHEQSELDALQESNAQKLKTLRASEITRGMVQQAELDLESARIALDSLRIKKQDAQHAIDALESEAGALKAQIIALKSTGRASRQEINNLEEALKNKQALLELEQEHLGNLETGVTLANQRLDITAQWTQRLGGLYGAGAELTQRETLEELQAPLQLEHRRLLNRAAELNRRLESLRGDGAAVRTERERLKNELFETDELIKIKQTELALADAELRLNQIEEAAPSPRALQQADALLDTLASQTQTIEQRLTVLEQQREVANKRLALGGAGRFPAAQQLRAVDKSVRALERQRERLLGLSESAQARRDALRAAYEGNLRRALTTRQPLPEGASGWQTLGDELASLPETLWRSAVTQVFATLGQADALRIVLLILAEGIWLGAMLWLRRYLNKLIVKVSAHERTFAVKVLLAKLRLLHGNTLRVVFAGAVVILLMLAGVTQPALSVVTALVMVWLGYVVAVDLMRLLLMQPELHQGETHPTLFQALRWAGLGLSLLIALTVLGHVAPITDTARDFIDRVFLLTWLPGLILALRYRHALLSPLAGVLSEAWLRASDRILSVVVVILFVSALIGLVGYLNLAWILAGFVGWFLLILIGWALLRGLLNDLFRWLETSGAQRRMAPPWLPRLFPSLRRAAQVLLAAGALWLLFRLFGWDAHSLPARWFKALLFSPLFEIGGKPFTPASLLFTTVLLVLLWHAARLTREAASRWLSYTVEDTGARHSLSVFAQYAVALIGFLIILRTLNIDLTALAIITGALAVGIGFGLQNIANNFISGVLILIERPVRTGDTVTIAGNEGDVTRIGIRSLSLRTSENQEVIIPNSEVISRAFVNWTYLDRIVRCWFVVSVTHQGDLSAVQRILREALAAHPAVLRGPAPEVWLDDIAGAAAIFRAHYSIDVSKHKREAVKSELLFQVCERFKEAGIQI